MSYYVNDVKKDKLSEFFAKRAEKYHVLLFTSKKETPSMYKALSKFFINKLIFGEVMQSETELLQIFNIRKFPTLMVIIDEEKNKYDLYNGKITYEDVKKYLNKYADKKRNIDASKVKEMTPNLYNTLGMCSSKDAKSICLIYLTRGSKPSRKDMKLLENISEKYENDHLKIFYLDLKKNKYFFESFQDIDSSNTQAVIVKGKRKKYLSLDKDEFNNNINNVVENIISGGGNFKKLLSGLNLGDNRNSDL